MTLTKSCDAFGVSIPNCPADSASLANSPNRQRHIPFRAIWRKVFIQYAEFFFSGGQRSCERR